MNQSQQSLLEPSELRQWTQVSPYRNLMSISGEYFALFVIQAGAIIVMENLGNWGLGSWVGVLVAVVTILLNGCLMHRIGLMGHEASHGLMVPNRGWNELLANLFCFFPLWSSAASYRAKHQGHHYHPNDPERDPNLAGSKADALYARFPMPRPSFIWNYYAKFFWPPFVFRNLLDLFRVLAVGKNADNGSTGSSTWFAKATSPMTLGIIYLVGLVVVIRSSASTGNGTFVFTLPVLYLGLAVLVWRLIPNTRFGNLKRTRNGKKMAMVRLLFYTALLLTFGWIRFLTGFNLASYYMLFWILPLVYVFPYLMLLREIYQHANLGTGKLNNSRIIHADFFTRWALLGYGNDFHLIHHLYPNIPHYHLRAAHEALLKKSPSYRESLIETTGVFRAPAGENSLLSSLGSKDLPSPSPSSS